MPPKTRDGAALVATDERLLLFGGCAPGGDQECRRTRDGFAFDPAEEAWEEMPPAPFAVSGASAWTGEEAIFLDTAGRGGLRGLAYAPDSGRWRPLPEAPLQAKGGDAVWTGSELVVWGGGGHDGPAATAGAAYDPETDSWRRIADAPFSLNAVSLVWTGSEVVAFGSRLDRRNWSRTRTAVGAAYNPATDAWRTIAVSRLSPQAHSAEWVGGSFVAYDYAGRYQRYEPERDRWDPKARMPLEVGECYPDSAAVGGRMLAFYCGQVAGASRPGSGQLERRRGRAHRGRQPRQRLPAGDPDLALRPARGARRRRLLPRRGDHIQRPRRGPVRLPRLAGLVLVLPAAAGEHVIGSLFTGQAEATGELLPNWTRISAGGAGE